MNSTTDFYDDWVSDSLKKITAQIERFSESHFFALIDGSQVDAAAKTVSTWKAEFARPFFSDTKEASLQDVSPWLVEPSRDSGQDRFLKRCMALQGAAHAVTWIISPLPAEALFKRLCRRMDATLPGDMEMLLRYFDTYRLPDLHRVLDDKQKKAFFGCAEAWIYLDRQGEMAVIDSDCLALDEHTELVFDEAQEQAILDAAFPDELLRILQQDQADLVENLPPQERYDRVKALVAQAQVHGIEGAKDLLYFCIVGLSEGEGFDAAPAWAKLLARVKTGHITFANAALAQAV
jgi:hypothetical protein